MLKRSKKDVVSLDEGEEDLSPLNDQPTKAESKSGLGNKFRAGLAGVTDATMRGVHACGEATREAGAAVKEKASEVSSFTVAASASTSSAVKGAFSKNQSEGGSEEAEKSSVEKKFPVFKTPIENTLKDQNGLWVREIPAVVHDMITYILTNDVIKEEGVFRISGRLVEVNALKESYDTHGSVDITTITDCHSATSLLKLFFRELPESILTSTLLPEFEKICTEPYNDKTIVPLMGLLPQVSRLVLAEIFDLLRIIVSFETVNLMSKSNLAIIFVPALSVSYDLFYFFLDNPQITLSYSTLAKQYLKPTNKFQTPPAYSRPPMASPNRTGNNNLTRSLPNQPQPHIVISPRTEDPPVYGSRPRGQAATPPAFLQGPPTDLPPPMMPPVGPPADLPPPMPHPEGTRPPIGFLTTQPPSTPSAVHPPTGLPPPMPGGLPPPMHPPSTPPPGPPAYAHPLHHSSPAVPTYHGQATPQPFPLPFQKPNPLSQSAPPIKSQDGHFVSHESPLQPSSSDHVKPIHAFTDSPKPSTTARSLPRTPQMTPPESPHGRVSPHPHPHIVPDALAMSSADLPPPPPTSQSYTAPHFSSPPAHHPPAYEPPPPYTPIHQEQASFHQPPPPLHQHVNHHFAASAPAPSGTPPRGSNPFRNKS